MTTTTKKELTSAEEHQLAEDLHVRLTKLEDELAAQRAVGHEKKATLEEKQIVLEKYQAARIAADRPRQA